mmetsp:Transcript_41593/g.48234  ORF Transcript_41593/g.48234 Transcript_41593/m.48234 type:complete len:129 (-) Transcript_41593:96-482(-)
MGFLIFGTHCVGMTLDEEDVGRNGVPSYVDRNDLLQNLQICRNDVVSSFQKVQMVCGSRDGQTDAKSPCLHACLRDVCDCAYARVYVHTYLHAYGRARVRDDHGDDHDDVRDGVRGDDHVHDVLCHAS